ncbi:MAG: AAA family ATPase, partial [Plesiomonas sp.]
MSRTIMLVPIGTGVGLTSVSLGVVRAMERKGVNVNFFKPICQPRQGGTEPDLTSSIINANGTVKTIEPFALSFAENLIGSGQTDVLLEQIVARFSEETKDADTVLIEGLVPTRKQSFANNVNFDIAKTLGAEIVFVITP